MTVQEFVRTVWAGRWLVVVAVLLSVGGAAYYLQNQVAEYQASAVVTLQGSQSPGSDGQQTSLTVTSDLDDVTSAPVLEAAATELGLADPRALVGQVSAETGSEDGLTFVVNAQAADPRLAQQTARAVADAYIARLGQLQEEEIAALDQQREQMREQLATVDAQLRDQPKDPLAAAERSTIIDQFQTLTVRINTLRSIAVPAEVHEPVGPATAVGLSPALVLLVAAFAGLLAGIGLAFAKRGLDIRVRSVAEAARIAESPVLAELYGVRAADREHRRVGDLPVSRRSASPFTESVRELRTAVQVFLTGREHSIVVVTATDPYAPRSFMTANLAASFALSGRRTVVVSGDLRRPALERHLPAPEGWSGPAHSVRPTTVANLRFAPIPEKDLDPADYLATTDVRRYLDALKQDAEIVVVDAPPVLAAADATILGGYADGVVLVVTAGRSVRAVLQEAAERLRINNVPLVGLALSGLKGDRRMLYATTYGADVDASSGLVRGVHALGRLVGRPGGGEHSASRTAPAPASPEGPPSGGEGPATSGDAPTRAAARTEPAEPAPDAQRAPAQQAGEPGSDTAEARPPLLSPAWSKVVSADAPPGDDGRTEGSEEGEVEHVETRAAAARRRPVRW